MAAVARHLCVALHPVHPPFSDLLYGIQANNFGGNLMNESKKCRAVLVRSFKGTGCSRERHCICRAANRHGRPRHPLEQKPLASWTSCFRAFSAGSSMGRHQNLHQKVRLEAVADSAFRGSVHSPALAAPSSAVYDKVEAVVFQLPLAARSRTDCAWRKARRLLGPAGASPALNISRDNVVSNTHDA